MTCKPLTPAEADALRARFWTTEPEGELLRRLIVAVRTADDKFNAAGRGGTKPWVELFLMPEFRAHGIELRLAQETGVAHSAEGKQ